MLHAVSLGGVLCVLWLLLSGFFSPLLLALGLASVVAVVAISHRMEVIDHEGHPIHLTWKAVTYFPWLLVEIAKANVDVAWAIVRPRMPIMPRLIRVPAEQRDDLGRVIYANSITLTPGTVTVSIEGGMLVVHALTEIAARELEGGDMGRRVTAVAGGTDDDGGNRPEGAA